MNKFFKTITVTCSLVIAATALAACGGAGEGGGKGPFTVTFDSNLDGTGWTQSNVTLVQPQTVEKGETATYRPIIFKGGENPNNLAFRYWATDKEGKNEYDFTKPVTGSITLYANWEHRHVVSYHGFINDYKQDVFDGDTAFRPDTEAGTRRVLGYYTDQAFGEGTLYDMSTPVKGDLDLYVKLGGSYLSAVELAGWAYSYGNPQHKLDEEQYLGKRIGNSEDGEVINAKTAAAMVKDDTKLELVGDDYETQYCKVHFGASPEAAWITTNFNLFLTENNVIGGTRNADVMTVTYKNLGPATVMRFYYVCGIAEGTGDAIKWNHTGNGMWEYFVDVDVRSNMKETDDWATVEIDLVEATTFTRIVTGENGEKTEVTVSEWGESDQLIIPRIEFVDKYYDEDRLCTWTGEKGLWRVTNLHLDNEVWLKGIEFSAKKA